MKCSNIYDAKCTMVYYGYYVLCNMYISPLPLTSRLRTLQSRCGGVKTFLNVTAYSTEQPINDNPQNRKCNFM